MQIRRDDGPNGAGRVGTEEKNSDANKGHRSRGQSGERDREREGDVSDLSRI